MKEFILKTDRWVTSGKKSILSQVEKISAKPGELDIRKLKQSIFNFSFSLLEKNISKADLKAILKDTFTEIKKTWFELKKVIKNDNIENTLSNIKINYHIHKFKSSQWKIDKDIHFAKIHELMESFVVNIVHKENMWRYDEDLVSAWTIWLFKAINSDFDPLQADFSTFSYMKIRKEVQEEKTKINTWFNMPTIHNYYYTVYAKLYKQNTWLDDIEFDDWVLADTVAKLRKWNEWITFNLIKDIVNHKISSVTSLDYEAWSDEYWSKTSLIDTIESDDTCEDIKQKIDNDILKWHLNNFLWRFPDYEKTILERKFGFDFWGDNSYPVYSIKVTRDWEEWVKEMVALKGNDAIKRVQMLWYEVQSTRNEVERTKRYETVVGWSLEKLREYFEIKKLTKVSVVALKKSEDKIVKQLETYLKDIIHKKWMDESNITVTA